MMKAALHEARLPPSAQTKKGRQMLAAKVQQGEG